MTVKVLKSLISSGKTAYVYPFAQNQPADRKRVALKEHQKNIQRSTYVGPTKDASSKDASRLIAPPASIRAPMFRRS